MNSTYSTCPVVLIPYNLPPWLCMKQSSFILSMIILGKSSLGNDIDVYLQPLVKELQLLWCRVDAYAAYNHERFNLRVALLWTINDYPAYAMLSGLSTKGYKACPYCTNLTPCYRFGGKICYVGHRKWLCANHSYRFESKKFDGTEEHGNAPTRPTRTEILRKQVKVGLCMERREIWGIRRRKESKDLEIVKVGKKMMMVEIMMMMLLIMYLEQREASFFDLEYWEHNLLQHYLDVMHIEKNVCDNILAIIFDMEKRRDWEK